MNESETTICGNVADSPQRRRAGDSQVTHFRMASTERKFDGAAQQWRDGKTFWIDVDCWNELGKNVAASVSKGDPVIVKGVLSTSEWEAENGKRSKTLCTALAVGHDLSRGGSVFQRSARPAVGDSNAVAESPTEDPPGSDTDYVPDEQTGLLVDRRTGEAVAAPF